MFQHTDRLDMSNKRRKHLEGGCDIDQSCVQMKEVMTED